MRNNMFGYYALAAVAYIVGGIITYKKQHCPARQQAVHYEGSRPDTLLMNNPNYKAPTYEVSYVDSINQQKPQTK